MARPFEKLNLKFTLLLSSGALLLGVIVYRLLVH
jgi:hypothetical protein